MADIFQYEYMNKYRYVFWCVLLDAGRAWSAYGSNGNQKAARRCGSFGADAGSPVKWSGAHTSRTDEDAFRYLEYVSTMLDKVEIMNRNLEESTRKEIIIIQLMTCYLWKR